MGSQSPRFIPVNQRFYEALDSAMDTYQSNEQIDAYKHFATLLGFSGQNRAASVYQKLNPNCDTSRLYADELVLMVERLGVYSAPIAHFFMGFCSNALEPNRLSLSQSAAAFSKIFGSFNAQLIESMADGSISERERIALVSLLDDATAKLQRLRSVLSYSDSSEASNDKI